MYKTRYLYDIIICSVWVPFLGVHFFPSWSIAYICGLCLTLSFLFHCLIQMLIENIILGSMVCSMWWLLLRWWKSCVYCKWLAYCTSTCLFKGILSWQWFYAICPFCSCDTQYSTSGKIFFWLLLPSISCVYNLPELLLFHTTWMSPVSVNWKLLLSLYIFYCYTYVLLSSSLVHLVGFIGSLPKLV